MVQEKHCASAFVGEWKLPTGFIVEVLNFTASVTLKNLYTLLGTLQLICLLVASLRRSLRELLEKLRRKPG